MGCSTIMLAIFITFHFIVRTHIRKTPRSQASFLLLAKSIMSDLFLTYFFNVCWVSRCSPLINNTDCVCTTVKLEFKRNNILPSDMLFNTQKVKILYTCRQTVRNGPTI